MGGAMSYFDQCLPKVVNMRDGSGCSLTRASLQAMTPDEFAALGDQEDLQRVYAMATEARMRGVEQPFIGKVLMGRLKYYGDKVNVLNVAGSRSIIQPYIPYRQKTVVNSGFFEVESGVQDGGGFRWVLTVKNNALFSQQNLPRIDRYFIPDNTLIVNHVGASGVSYTTKFKIISAADATGGGVSKATVVIEPNVTSVLWGTMTSGQKLPYQPEGGLVLVGTNSVSDYEAWCNVGAVDNPNNLIFFWFQTSRKAHAVSQEYIKALTAPNANEFFKVFNTLPYKEQVKQQDVRFDREWWNSVFWGQPTNEHQDVNDWQGKLPEVTDIDDNSCVLEYKAEAEGIEYQLARCNRVMDLAGGPLDMDTLGESFYQIIRHRQNTNETGDILYDLDLQADMVTASRFKSFFVSYMKKKYGIQATFEMAGEANVAFKKETGLGYNSYDLEDWNVRINVVSDPFFNDLRGAAPSAHRSASTYALVLDYSDIDIGIVKSASRKNVYPNPSDIPADYKCVIQRNEKTYSLFSQTWFPAVKAPERHLLIKGFDASACVTGTVTSCADAVYTG
jgi:hypothetical protein